MCRSEQDRLCGPAPCCRAADLAWKPRPGGVSEWMTRVASEKEEDREGRTVGEEAPAAPATHKGDDGMRHGDQGERGEGDQQAAMRGVTEAQTAERCQADVAEACSREPPAQQQRQPRRHRSEQDQKQRDGRPPHRSWWTHRPPSFTERNSAGAWYPAYARAPTSRDQCTTVPNAGCRRRWRRPGAPTACGRCEDASVATGDDGRLADPAGTDCRGEGGPVLELLPRRGHRCRLLLRHRGLQSLLVRRRGGL